MQLNRRGLVTYTNQINMKRILSLSRLKNAVGLIVFLFIQNFSSAQTVVYNVYLGNLINQGSNCGSGGYYNGCNGSYGVSWTSAIGVAPTSVTFQFGGAIRCDGTAGRNSVLNGNTGTQTSFTIVSGNCLCNSVAYLNTVNMNPIGYNPGAYNQLMITGFSSCEGFDDGIGGLPAGVFARVTVVYPIGLPIELASFNARAAVNNVVLDWETVSERDNDYFNVEKSTDGIHWDPIIEVDGAGTSLAPIKYTSKDLNPTVGTTYYRLKQTDFDGRFNYFFVRAVTYEKARQIEVFPNPFVGEITLTKLKGQLFPLTVSISDPLGKTVIHQELEEEIDEITLGLDAELASGLYTIIITSNDEQFIHRVLKK